jgi:EamA domain-containing membrane protein RarD
MRRRNTLYWICQLGGWLFYGLALMFFAFIFNNKTNDILYPRIAISIFFGVLCTHLLREMIVRLDLRPPITARNWWLHVLTILGAVLLFNLANSTAVEWLGFGKYAVYIQPNFRFAADYCLGFHLLYLALYRFGFCE